VASIRKRRGRFEVRWRDRRGQRSRTFTRRGDAERFKVEVERQAQLGALFEPSAVSFAEFLAGWLERYEPQVRPSTYERAVQALSTVRELERWRLHEIRAADVEDQIAVVARRAPRQATMALRYVKQVLKNAQQRGHRIDPSILAIKPPRYEEREPRFLTWEEVQRLASLCVEGPLVVFAALTGLRQGELLLCVALTLMSRSGLFESSADLVVALRLGRSRVAGA
jgi:integrase